MMDTAVRLILPHQSQLVQVHSYPIMLYASAQPLYSQLIHSSFYPWTSIPIHASIWIASWMDYKVPRCKSGKMQGQGVKQGVKQAPCKFYIPGPVSALLATAQQQSFQSKVDVHLCGPALSIVSGQRIFELAIRLTKQHPEKFMPAAAFCCC